MAAVSRKIPVPGSSILGMPILGIVVAVAALIVDQLSKYIIVEDVMRPEGVVGTPYLTDKVIAVLPVFNLRLSWNAGISFSLFNSGTTAATFTLLAVQLAVSLTLIWWLRHLDKRWLQVACGLIIGGAIGNILDRVMFGAVADFLDFYWGTWHFPTFNGADTFISIGAGMWLLDAVLAPPHDTALTQGESSRD